MEQFGCWVQCLPFSLTPQWWPISTGASNQEELLQIMIGILAAYQDLCAAQTRILCEILFFIPTSVERTVVFFGGAGDSFCNGQVNPIYLLCTSKCHWSFFLNMQNLCSSILLSQRKTCFLFPKPITVHCVEFYWWRNELDKVKRLLQTSRVECL